MPEFISISPTTLQPLAGRMAMRCVACRMPAYAQPLGMSQGMGYTIFKVSCSRCGEYRCTPDASGSLKWDQLTDSQRANISGFFRENPSFLVSSDRDVEYLTTLSTPSVAAKAMKFLGTLARMFPIPGTPLLCELNGIDLQAAHFLGVAGHTYPSDETADLAAMRLFPALSYAWASNQDELRFVVTDYLSDQGYLLLDNTNSARPRFRISAKGWEALQGAVLSGSKTGFVAMWFCDAMDNLWREAINPAIKEAGYEPVNLRFKEHNNRIDDEIIASIRGAKFVVADFTGHRPNVYYEAGFAAGQGKPVICCVREEEKKSAHFDTRQLPHIVWTVERLGELKDKLKNRILATIGQGPVRVD